MSKPRPRWPSPALVISIVALVVALGGTSYAAFKVGTKNIKNGAVTTKKLHNGAVTNGKLANGAVTNGKLANGAVTGSKVNLGSLGTVPSASFAGNAGALGGLSSNAFAPVIYASVNADGTVNASQSKGISSANVTGHLTGTYCFSGLPFTPKSGSVAITAEISNPSATTQVLLGGGVVNCNSGTGVTAEVETYDSPGSFHDEPFYIVLYG